MTDFDYGLAGRRTAWPVASPAEMFWPDILSPVSSRGGPRVRRLAAGGKRIRTLGPRYIDDAFETILVA